MSFRSQLWSLERATPTYGVDAYASYGDDAYDDGVDDDLDDPQRAADVHALDPHRPADGSAGVGGAATATVMRRRALAYRRRRQVLSTLVMATAVCLAPSVVLGGPWIAAEAVASTLLVLYLGLLIRRGRHEAERAQKVRYLTPIRAPRPSVVIIGSGAAR